MTLETTGNGLAGVSVTKKKRQTIKHVMNRCPDEAGVAHGTLSFSLRETTVIDQPGSHGVFVELSTYEGKSPRTSTTTRGSSRST